MAASSHRKHLRRYEIERQPRFLTFSCYQRLPLLRNENIKAAFIAQIDEARRRAGFKLLAWVVMPEHVHLVIVPDLPAVGMPAVTTAIKRPFARSIITRWRELDAPILARLRTSAGDVRFWQHGGGYDRNIRDEAELREKIDYIHRNPVTRGLAASSCDYPWSSARWHAGWHEESLLTIDAL